MLKYCGYLSSSDINSLALIVGSKVALLVPNLDASFTAMGDAKLAKALMSLSVYFNIFCALQDYHG